MKYYSTNRQSPPATLEEAVIKSLAGDKGLYMPERIPALDKNVIASMKNMSFQEIACIVADAFFGDDMDRQALRDIVCDTLSFDAPIVRVRDDVYSLELFHGPTLAFKDVGARFMARALSWFVRQRGLDREVNVLVATSGDTGGAVANGFLGVPGVRVFVLYPAGKVSPIQECQFTTLGQNITALEIDGTFDDCQALVKAAFVDDEMNGRLQLTSANSINVARFLPQSFYYFNAYAQLDKIGKASNVVFSVPSGNFGNLTAGLFAFRMGLPVGRFIAANNRNDIFCEYMRTGQYNPRPSVETYANAMDVGNPSNFARILDMFGEKREAIAAVLSGERYTDEQIADTMHDVWYSYGYLLDPHGACGYQALADCLKPSETGVFLETAHPVKFKETVEKIFAVGETECCAPTPPRLSTGKLQKFIDGAKKSVPLSKNFADFKAFMIG